jgi:long-subunit fatty acid transport protein
MGSGRQQAVTLKARGLSGAVLATLLMTGSWSSPGSAQNGDVLPELPFTARLGVGARASGMGFAHGAVSEDGSSLYYNPAGLSQIRRIELSGGVIHDAHDRKVAFDTSGEFDGTGVSVQDAEISATQLGHLSLAYPVPAYRGSLVFGFSYQRIASLKSDYFRDGTLREATPQGNGLYESESFAESGSVNYWTGGVAADVSPHVSIGGSISYIQGDTRQDFEIQRLRTRPGNPPDVEDSDEVFKSEEFRDADLTGITGSFGVLARVSESVRAGLTVDLPQRYEFDGSVSSRFEDREKIDTQSFFFEDTITLPFSFLASVAVTPPNLLLAADLRLTDWTQIDFEGSVLSGRENAYRSTADINIGAEYQLPFHPTRIRAGWSRQPIPYRLQAAEIDYTFVPDDGDTDTDDDASYFLRAYPEADITTERNYVTLGIGTLVDKTMTIDLAYVHGIYERTGGAVSEEWSTNRVFGTATFRF